MADFLDRAHDIEEHHRAVALHSQHERAGLDGKTLADSAKNCTECGDAIPQPRREALPGVQRCVDCQTLSEIAMTDSHDRGMKCHNSR